MEVGGTAERALTRLLSYLFHDVYDEDPASSGFTGAAADRYKLTRRAFEDQLDGIASARRDAPVLLRRRPSFDDGAIPFAITFDDGGVSFHATASELLERRGWRAHCFVATRFIGSRGFLDAAQIRDLDRRGHVIGAHSASHPPRLSYRNHEDIVREWKESREALADLLNHDVTVASVPGGYFSSRVASAAKKAGIEVLFTSEPELRVRQVEGCWVLGRFTIRPGHEPDFGRRLAALDQRICAREWMSWNTKKVIKAVFIDPLRRLA